jgi:hypothetical protein
MHYTTTTLYILGWILALDFACFLLWLASGQAPVDSTYFGMITGTIVKLFI